MHAILTHGFILTAVMMIHLLIQNKVICVCVLFMSKVCKDRFTYSHMVGRVLHTAPVSLLRESGSEVPVPQQCVPETSGPMSMLVSRALHGAFL